MWKKMQSYLEIKYHNPENLIILSHSWHTKQIQFCLGFLSPFWHFQASWRRQSLAVSRDKASQSLLRLIFPFISAQQTAHIVSTRSHVWPKQTGISSLSKFGERQEGEDGRPHSAVLHPVIWLDREVWALLPQTPTPFLVTPPSQQGPLMLFILFQSYLGCYDCLTHAFWDFPPIPNSTEKCLVGVMSLPVIFQRVTRVLTVQAAERRLFTQKQLLEGRPIALRWPRQAGTLQSQVNSPAR